MYECYNCGYKSEKSKLIRHLSNKYKCKSIRDTEIDLNECKEYILNKYSYNDYILITQNISNNNNLEKLNIINNNLTIENNEYKNEINEYKNEINILKDKIQELTTESANNKVKWANDKEKLLCKITKYNKIINNNIINNSNNITVNIINFKDTYNNITLTDDEIRACVNNKNRQYAMNALELAHFNTKYPEFMNVYISNMNNNKMKVYDNNKWTYGYFNKEIENMMDKMELLALYKFDEWDNNDIPYKREKHNYDVYQKRKLNVNIRPNMINNIRKMLYDNRHMIKK